MGWSPAKFENCENFVQTIEDSVVQWTKDLQLKCTRFMKAGCYQCEQPTSPYQIFKGYDKCLYATTPPADDDDPTQDDAPVIKGIADDDDPTLDDDDFEDLD